MKQLVLFDIDGTLIDHIPSKKWPSFFRFRYAIKKVFGVEAIVDPVTNYNGWVDLQIAADMVKSYGITRETVLAKSSLYAEALHEFALTCVTRTDKLYVAIPEAVALSQHLHTAGFPLGLLTGNVERMARWKLTHADVPDIFSFGLFGDDVDDRVTLAKTVFERAKKHFGITFLPKDIVVVGDAIGDIRCGKAIGATTIIVMTGHHSTREALAAENPDVLVNTLADPAVLTYFHL